MSGPWPDVMRRAVVPLSRIANIQLGKMLQPVAANAFDREVPYLRAGSLSQIETLGDLPTMFASPSDIPTYGVSQGDLVVAEGGDVGRAEFVPGVPSESIIQNSLHRVRAKESDVRYLKYCLDAIYGSEWLEVLCNKSTFGHLTLEKIRSLPVPSWPLAEQQSLADYLDWETARIDALIAAKRRTMNLLAERLQAFVSRCITDESAQRDSEVPWLGPIPDDWHVQPVWQLFRLGRGRVMSHEDIANNPGDYPVYSSQTAADGVMGTIGTFDFDGAYLTWTTDGANAGTVFARTGRFSCTNVCGTLKPRGQCDLAFYQFVLNRATGWYVRHDINPKLMNEVMARIRVPVPPIEEQIRIGALLTGIHEQWQSVVKTMSVSVELLEERRQAVTTAAVTGELDILVMTG